MENVIYDIYTKVNSKLQLNSNETLDAMMVASNIMNEPLSDTEIAKIKEFSKRLEPQYCPDFKSIHEEETNIAIWRVVGWVIRTHTLLNHVRELLSIYTHISCPNITVEYTEDGKWIAKTKNEKELKEFVREMNSYYGINLIRDLIEFADETLS